MQAKLEKRRKLIKELSKGMCIGIMFGKVNLKITDVACVCIIPSLAEMHGNQFGVSLFGQATEIGCLLCELSIHVSDPS